jgi:hypothetical protein
VYFSASVDGGAIWTAPIQVDNGNPNDAWEPTVSVDQSIGAVSIAWYDRRDDPNNRLYRVYYTQSTDGGMTFLPSQLRVADQPSSAGLNCSGTGDAMGLAAAGGIAHPVWTDTRNGLDQLFTAPVSELVAAQVKPSRGFIAAQTMTDVYWMNFIPGKFAGDGHVDLLGWASNDSRLALLTGNGDGTFRPAAFTSPLTNGFLNWAGSADLNRDGKLDVVFETNDGSLWAKLGNGDGTFQTTVAFPMPAGMFTQRSPIIVDVNGDGIPDVILPAQAQGSSTTSLVTWFGNGDGTFRLGPTQPLQGYLNSFTAADFNGDSIPDVAVGYQQGSAAPSLAILLGDGQGHFNQAASYDAGVNPTQIVGADINHDGRPDLVVSSAVAFSQSFQLMTFINGGGTGQALFNAPTAYPEVEQPTEIVAADFNNDGYTDIAWLGLDSNGNTRSNLITVMVGSATGALSVRSIYDSPAVRGLVAADLTGGGRADLIVGRFLLLGNGDATFIAARRFVVGTRLAGVATGDFNKDGKLDAAVLTGWDCCPEQTAGVSIFLGTGDGSFQPPAHYAVSTQAGTPVAMVVADFKGNGILDIAVLLNGQVSVLMGKGDGTFNPAASSPAGVGNLDMPTGLATGEFDSDSHPDLVIASSSGIHLLAGQGDGTFTIGNSYSLPSISAIGVADLNHDGKSDLIASTINSGVVYLGNGDGTLTQTSILANGRVANVVAFNDFNGDGSVDAVFFGSQGMWIYLGSGDGTFQPNGPNPSSWFGGTSLTIGDFTGGGRLDVTLAGTSSGGIVVLRGNGDGTFSESTAYAAPSGSIASGDFNGDGQADLVTTGLQGVQSSGTDLALLLANRRDAAISPSSLAFGQQAIGTAAPTQTVTLSNGGTAPMPVALASIGGANAPDFTKTADMCSGLRLLPGRSCTVTIGFSPLGAGTRSATLTVVDGWPGSPRQVALSGSGPGAAILLNPRAAAPTTSSNVSSRRGLSRAV